MNEEEISFEILNAYVDGELNKADAADVALYIANDPDLARQVAILTRLRSSVMEAVEVPEINLIQQPAIKKPMVAGLLVASIALLALVGGWMLFSSSSVQPLLPQWYEETAKALDNWPEKSETSFPLLQTTVPTGSLTGAYVPDLTAAKLYINHVEEKRSLNMGSLRVVGYRGTRGCRVILTIFANGGKFPKDKIMLEIGGLHAFAWKAGSFGYAIIADGMDAERFRLIADTAEDTTLRHLPVDAETRLALGLNRERSAPCRA